MVAYNEEPKELLDHWHFYSGFKLILFFILYFYLWVLDISFSKSSLIYLTLGFSFNFFNRSIATH